MSKLCVYRKSNKVTMKEEFPDYDMYVNLDRAGFDDIQGMRFEKILIVKGCTEYDEEQLEKHLLAVEDDFVLTEGTVDFINFTTKELNNSV